MPDETSKPMTEETGLMILEELRKLTAMLPQVLPLLDNPATRFISRRKGL